MSAVLRMPAGPAALEWRDVTLDLGEFAVRDVSLRVDPGAWIAIVGPTGAGKSLLLEVAAGFRRPGFGCVLRNGRDVTAAPPEARRIAYVPQDDLLFPHLDVRGNLLFAVPRRARRLAADRFAEIASGLGISHLLDRRIGAISGGEAQRVVAGRALLADADVLLLDECTSALDETTRRDIGSFLERQRRRRSLSIVQVTHDRDEAHRLADAVVAIRAGRLEGVVAERAASDRGDSARAGPDGPRRLAVVAAPSATPFPQASSFIPRPGE